MSAFSSNETASITKTAEVKQSELTLTPSDSLGEVYELERCTSWIFDRNAKKIPDLDFSSLNWLDFLSILADQKSFMISSLVLPLQMLVESIENYFKDRFSLTIQYLPFPYHKLIVCLQFPDRLLGDSAEVALRLGKKVESKIYILGDTSYGSCCVDEVAAEHVDADAIIHFGHACLSPTKRLPVLYVFQKKLLDVNHFVSCFKNTYTDVSQRILLLYDVCYVGHIGSVSAQISGEYENFVVSRLCTEPRSEAAPHYVIKFGRVWNFHEGSTEEDCHVVFIGGDGRTLTNFALSLSAPSFRQYDPSSKSPSLSVYDARKSKFLMSRMYLVEKVKDARTLGIVVGTLGVSDYLAAIDRVKKLAATKGKKCYIFAVGKPNVAKLANFPEIDAFVLISCPENSQMDSKEFYRPIVMPYEVELACGNQRSWNENYVVDFRELLPGGKHHTEVKELASDEDVGDVSLITGQLRQLSSSARSVEDSAGNTVALKGDLTVSGVLQSGSEYLLQRSWQGLQQDLGQTEVKLAEKGQSGIAQAYTSDKETLHQQQS